MPADIRIQKLTLYMVLLNAFTTPLTLSSVNVALPIMTRELRLDAITVSWVPMAYLMASAMLLLIFGRLADRYGRKKLFLLGTFLMIITSTLASRVNSGDSLVVMRFLQGCSASILYATQMALVTSVYSSNERGKVVGMTVSAIYVGLSLGPVLGGYVVDHMGWRGSFLLHIPLACIVLLMSAGLRGKEWLSDEKHDFDIVGALIYILAIFFLCYGVSLMQYSISILILLLSVSLFTVFLRFEYTQRYPLLDVRLFFTNRIFTFSSITSLILYTATFANVVLVSFYLQYLKSYSATEAGFMMMIQPVTMALIAPFSGSLSDRIEPGILASVGIVITIIGLTLLALLETASSSIYIASALFFIGIGFSLFSSPNANAIMGSVEKKNYGIATAVVSTMRIFGQLTSMVLVSVFFSIYIGSNEIVPDKYPQLEQLIQVTYTVATLICIPGLFFSLARGKLHQS